MDEGYVTFKDAKDNESDDDERECSDDQVTIHQTTTNLQDHNKRDSIGQISFLQDGFKNDDDE